MDRDTGMDAHSDMEALVERLGALPRDAEEGEDGWPRVRARIASNGARRGWTRAAAAVVIFAAGGLGGFLMADRGQERRSTAAIDEALTLAAEVQRTGTEYVAALAAFAAVVDSISADVRAQGRDAAIATLFGAANELVAIGGPPDGVIVPGRGVGRSPVRF